MQKQGMFSIWAQKVMVRRRSAHGNSQKDPKKQQLAFCAVLEQIAEGNDLIMGMMLESHLQGGNALSITDPCLDWKTTEELILWAYQSLPSMQLSHH